MVKSDTSDDSFSLLKSGSWKYDNFTKSTLKSYINTYFPKYISTFSHPLSTVNGGSLYIGVDDSGIVHGIPYTGILSEDYVKKLIAGTHKKIRAVKGADDSDCLKRYLSFVKVQVIKLNTEKYSLEDSGLTSDYNIKMYEKLKIKKDADDAVRAEYLVKKRRWEKFFNSSSQKIFDIMNDRYIRKQIIELIKKHSKSTTKLRPEYKNIYAYCDIPTDYWKLISELKSDIKYGKVSYEMAEKHRNDKLSPIYWGLVWRDLKTAPSKILKPTPYYSRGKYAHKAALAVSQVPKMIPCWLKTNPDLNLYVIKIDFGGNYSPENFLEYMDSSGSWIRSYRTSVCGEPSCQPI
jgi:hypothetical protein